MIHRVARLALRAKLATLSVCTTGSTTLAATATGYTRASGSFLDDGFAPGVELTPAGFTQTTTAVVEAVTALTLTVVGSRTVESAASGRTLSVGLPSSCAWENVEFTPAAGVPYLTEEYLPGPSVQYGIGQSNETELLPTYLPRVHVPAGFGAGAADAYADAILTLFAPKTAITLAGARLHVTTRPGPFRGQLLQSSPGFAMVPVTIPLLLRYPGPVGEVEDWGLIRDPVLTLEDLGVL